VAGYDPEDPATSACLTPGVCFDDYLRFLDKHALGGARIAVPPTTDPIVLAAVDVLIAQGAYVEFIPALPPVGVPGALNYGFKRDLNAYLATLPDSWPIHTLSDVIAFNLITPGALKGSRHQPPRRCRPIASSAPDKPLQKSQEAVRV